MRLSLKLLGTPQLHLDQRAVTANRRAVVALLAYLAVNELSHPRQRPTRESLGALLWTDYDYSKALANLRHTLWEVNRLIGDGWIVAEQEALYLNPHADLTLDIAQFQSLFQQAARQPEPAVRVPLLLEAANLYRADFLAGFHLREAVSFHEWASLEAQNLRRDLVSILTMLVDSYSAMEKTESGVPYAQRLVALDPLDESAHSRLMELYVQIDQPSAALHQYQTLEKLLRRELNLDPQPETHALYKKIRKGEFKPFSIEKKLGQVKKIVPKHNLPSHLTSFVGRGKEREAVAGLLAENRLVTLTGPGGIGKTRLALMIGQSLLKNYPGGVWFIPLESLTDEKFVPQAVASVFGLGEMPDQTIMETLVNALQDKMLLLILDNCEHLLDVCAQLAQALLQNCPGIRILATSREVLRLEGEASYHVRSLAIPKTVKTNSVAEMLEFESVRLFADRAALVLSSFTITKENIDAVIEICSRVDGIPLAIELAAAHVDIFKLDEILKQLNRSFDLLASNRRSVLPRHQTMRASIDWGWTLLAESEQTFMRRLSVFAGGWTLHAAQDVCQGKALELISALVKKSWVHVHQEAEHETRYHFHEMVQKYAQEKLIEAGEEEGMRNRHLEYFLELARRLEPALHGTDQLLWLDSLFIERENIRAALQWAARADLQAGLYLSNRLRAFWESYELREEARWLLMI